MDRAIKLDEVAVIRWLLDYAAVTDVTPYKSRPIEELRVLDKACQCGCSSLDFKPQAWGQAEMIADAFAVYPDGQQAGLILWGKQGELVLLEVYDCHPGASSRFPEISNLNSFEDSATSP